jgi:hypothetical protein
MLADSKVFIVRWINENIPASGYNDRVDGAGETPLSRNLASDCIADANIAGFTDAEITEAAKNIAGRGGTLAAFIATAIERANGRDRLTGTTRSMPR